MNGSAKSEDQAILLESPYFAVNKDARDAAYALAELLDGIRKEAELAVVVLAEQYRLHILCGEQRGLLEEEGERAKKGLPDVEVQVHEKDLRRRAVEVAAIGFDHVGLVVDDMHGGDVVR